ncbi:AzlC family ABC transporter permease [Sorangium sp. So ce381]|uniref:AzlC family ABC transporter permease n=1 Tax=Sorangium sp. So ce381 TaxID=3133307 RepID=UPI003F5CAC42
MTTTPFRQGLHASAPVVISFLMSFFGVGMLSRAAGLSLGQSVAMSAFVFAGPAQFAILTAFQSGASTAVILLSVLVINFRFFVMAVNLVRSFRGVPLVQIVPALPMLSASTFAVTAVEAGERSGRDNFRYFMGVCLGSYPVAVAMTAAGYLASRGFGSNALRAVTVILPLYFGILLAKERGSPSSLAAAIAAFCLNPILSLALPRDAASLGAIFVAAVIIAGFTADGSDNDKEAGV